MKTPSYFVLPIVAFLVTENVNTAVAQTATPVVLTAATAPAGVRPALADPVREALRTLPQAKKKFLAGLPIGDQFLLSVRVAASDTSFRQASARVLGWRGNTVQALLLPAAADSAPPVEPTPVSFPETAVVDWTLLRASGREEGNYVGRYNETAAQVAGMRLR